MEQNTDQRSLYKYVDRRGNACEVPVEVTDYKRAAEAGLSLAQYVNRKVALSDGGYDDKRGTPFQQIMAHMGLFLRDGGPGIRPPNMKDVLEGNAGFNLGVITRNDGSSNNTPSGRLLFPEVILNIIESQLHEDKTDFVQGFNSMVAVTANVAGSKVDWPIINTTGPRDAEYASQPISQLAEPPNMITITLSEATKRVPTKSIGLTVADEALQAATLDLVGLAMTFQSREERIRMIEAGLAAMMDGDTDTGETALSSVTAQSLDGTISAAGTMTQKAWIHYLRDNYRKMGISNIICDIDTALALEGRSGKPTNQTDNPNSPRIDSLFSVENLGITAPKVLLVDTATIGANTVVGLDSRYAIRRIVNVSASYSAIEQYVMRKATSFRVDYGEIYHKIFSDAWKKMTLTV
jgi:hypothetical protein